MQHLSLQSMLLRLLAPASLLLVLVRPVLGQDPIAADWSYASYGSSFGAREILAAEQDGITSVLVDSRFYWTITRFDAATGGYAQVYCSPYSVEQVRDLHVADLTGDGRLEIAVLRADGWVTIRDFDTQKLKLHWDSGLDQVSGLASGNQSATGGEELAILSEGSLRLFDRTGAMLIEIPGGGDFLEIGQVDDDPSLEAVTSKGAVFDLATGALEWHQLDRDRTDLRLIDIDGDGRDEIIAATDHSIRAFDAELRSEKWSISVDDPRSIEVDDIDLDGELELIVGDQQRTEIHCFEVSSGSLEWTLHSPDGGIAQLCVGDLDLDGTRELCWSSGSFSTGPDQLHVGEGPTDSIEWSSELLDQKFLGPLQGDLDGDGQDEIVMVVKTSHSGRSGRMIVFDALSHEVIGISPQVLEQSSANGVHSVCLADPDGDGRSQIFVGGDALYDGLIQEWHFDSARQFTLGWQNLSHPDGSQFVSLAVGDVDGDGAMEILGGVDETHSGSAGYFVYVYDYLTGAEERRISTPWSALDLLAVDLNDDGVPEIAFISQGGDGFIYSNGGQQLEARIPGQFDSLSSYRPRSIHRNALVLGGRNGEVEAYVASGGFAYQLWSRQVGTEQIDGVFVAPNGKFLVATEGHVRIIDRRSGLELGRTESYGLGFGHTILLDRPNRSFLSCGWAGLHEFQF
jgi:outer membrane protein assembly factor BamB